MTHPMEPVLFDQDDPRVRGEAHGELWREEVRELAAIRTALTIKKGTFADAEEVRAVAALHLPVLEATDSALYQELVGIARGAAVTPEDVVVVNHYTDLRDVPGSSPDPPRADDPGGCTAIYINGADGPVLGQTWDMHGTAERFVRMLRIQPRGGDEELLCFTLTGCLGMTGLSATGVGVTINNLTSTDAQVGLVWPAVVRRLLAQANADQAHELLMRTRLSSGHHYMIADSESFFGVETSGKLKVITQTGPKAARLHTNHCFDPVLRKYERIGPQSTTFERFNLATTLYKQQLPNTAEKLFDLLSSHEGHPRSICSHVDDAEGDPSASKTCGIIVMRLSGGSAVVTNGCGQVGERLDVRLERWHGVAR